MSEMRKSEWLYSSEYILCPAGGDVTPLLAPTRCFKSGTQSNSELILSLNPKRADYSKIKGFTMKNIPDTDTMSRLSLSEKGWKGSGLPEMGLTLSTLEYLASNWGLSSSWLTTHIPVWAIGLWLYLPYCSNNSHFHTMLAAANSEDARHEHYNCEVIKWYRIHLGILLTHLFLLPINEIPVISQLCPPPFPELQEYCGCWGDKESIPPSVNFDM